jgi:hypothetical protein
MKSAAVLAAVAGLAFAGSANAQFSGPYAPGNWTFQNNGGDGSLIDNSPGSVTVIGNNNASGILTDTDLTIAALAGGTWSFDWSYFSLDTGTWDSAYYLLNGVETFIAANNSQGVGSVSIPVTGGDIIGFRVRSQDGAFGAGELTISNFSAPIPAPGSLALLGMGGLIAARRRR